MASIDIDIDDIVCGMMDYEKQELVDELYEDGYVAKKDPRYDMDENGFTNEFDEEVAKLIGNGWKLSKEDEEIILKITKKLIV